MKHVFVINPKAGKKDLTKKIGEAVQEIFKENDYLIYVTKAPQDAKRFVREYCEEHPEEELRFYSCGGDGTLNEVVNGVVGYPNAAITCYPCGSGNDFIKYFGKAEDFLNLKALSSGKEKVIDLVKFNDSYVANIFNIGFDADVCERMIRYKRLPLISGKGAYILGVIVSFFKKLTHHLRITKDGEEIFNGEGMLCAMANAICYGGGFYCAPHASVTDGLLDIVVVRKLSRMKFLKFIKIYKNGEHLDKEELKEYIIYHQGKAVTIESSEPINCCFDGDIAKAQKFEIEIIPQALRFVVPEKL